MAATTPETPLPSRASQSTAPLLAPDTVNTIDELLKLHTYNSPHSNLISYPLSRYDDFKQYTAQELDRFSDAAVSHYIRAGLEPADPNAEKAPVVAILAPSNFEYIITIIALNRLGWSILFLSTRLSTAAYDLLLAEAQCELVITIDDYIETLDRIQTLRQSYPLRSVTILRPMDYVSHSTNKFHRIYDAQKESSKIAWIIHSSGSTGLPKPIFLTNAQCLANFRNGFPLRSFITSPLFHSHALMELFRSICRKSGIFVANYNLPVTRQGLVKALKVARPELIAVVPYVLQLLGEGKDGIAELAKAKIVLFAGARCPDELGDKLVAGGVNLVSNYGSSETGAIMNSIRPDGDTEWDYLRLIHPRAEHVLMDEIARGIFECVALDGLPSKGPSNSNNPPNSYRTRDLFTRHPDPTKSNFWKYLTRLDDRITLLNGEKVLPLPIEGLLREDTLVKEAVVFGIGRKMPGILIFRKENSAHLSDGEYLTAIWPSIEVANAKAETFSQISRELVIILSPEMPYPRTDKGTFIRAQMYQVFAPLIDETYTQFEETEVGSLQLDVPDLEGFLLDQFASILNVHLGTESDIFGAGVDSLQAIRIWGVLRKKLDLGQRRNDLSQNVVFEKGTVKALARHLYSLRTGEPEEDRSEIELMKEMIEKYSKFETPSPQGAYPEKDVVVRSLGAYVLAELVKRENVAQVWTLVRASDPSTATKRISNSLSSRNIQLSPFEHSKIIALPAEFSDPDLGLPATSLSSLLHSLTHVIHAAWAVNFNLGVSSFEQQHIRGVHNLLNLSLRTMLRKPPRFFFCSSSAAVSGMPRPGIVPEAVLEDLSHAAKTGYGRSKMVAEHIVRNAVLSTGMYARVLRIGQLAGDTKEGEWNETEAIPLMIRSALATGSLPMLDETCVWLPVDTAASSILDLAFTPSRSPNEDSDPNLVYHILNPCSFHWTRDLLPALSRTVLPVFEVLPTAQWLQRLHQSEDDPSRNPSIKLLGFWEMRYGSIGTDWQDVGHGVTEERLIYSLECSLQCSPALRGAENIVGDSLVDKFVQKWMERWT